MKGKAQSEKTARVMVHMPADLWEWCQSHDMSGMSFIRSCLQNMRAGLMIPASRQEFDLRIELDALIERAHNALRERSHD